MSGRGTIAEYTPVQVRDQHLMMVQYSFQRVLKEFTDRAFNSHELVENIELYAGATNYVEHRLGREPRGWVVVRNDEFVNLREEIAETDSFHLALEPSVNATVSLVVF